MKPFEGKYIVYQINCSDNPYLSWATEGDNGEDYPTIYDTRFEAVKSIVRLLNDLVDAEESGNMSEDTVESEFNVNRIAYCDLDEKGWFTVYDLDDYDNVETIFEGLLTEWRDF